MSDDELARVIDARPTSCPNTFAGGCRCPEHNPGLLRHAQDAATFLAFLPDAVLEPTPACRVDPMMCDCPQHMAERTAAIRGHRERQIRQPWET